MFYLSYVLNGLKEGVVLMLVVKWWTGFDVGGEVVDFSLLDVCLGLGFYSLVDFVNLKTPLLFYFELFMNVCYGWILQDKVCP